MDSTLDMYNDYIEDEMILIKKYCLLLNEYCVQLSDKGKISFIEEVNPLLKKRGMDTMEDLILFLTNDQYKNV